MIKLVVFFSRGMSLEGWMRAGMLERELLLFKSLLPNVSQLSFVTYGGAADVALGRQYIPEVEILANVNALPPNRYSVLSPWIHRAALRRATVFRTNQINGSWSAVAAKTMFRKPLVVRCGFLWADVVKRLGASTLQCRAAVWLERLAFRRADRIVVAAAADRRRILDRDAVASDRVTVIPNYVDTARFAPSLQTTRDPHLVVTVGRLDHQKNFAALIEAIGARPALSLILVGDGPLRSELMSLAARCGARVEFAGTLPHADLPALLNRAGVFVLPSHYEGNPKALIEAMACGAPVIGANTPGIREVIVHRENGYVCGTLPADIATALDAVVADGGLRATMSAGARAYVEAHCSLERAVADELTILRDVTRSVAHA